MSKSISIDQRLQRPLHLTPEISKPSEKISANASRTCIISKSYAMKDLKFASPEDVQRAINRVNLNDLNAYYVQADVAIKNAQSFLHTQGAMIQMFTQEIAKRNVQKVPEPSVKSKGKKNSR